MNRLDSSKRAQIVAALVEGTSIRAIVRMFGVSKNTVAKLLLEVGAACAIYQDKHLRNLTCKRVQCDEIWSYVGAKDKNLPADKQGQFGFGSVWTWTALDADTKLICSWMVGGRDAGAAYDFMQDLAGRLANRIQLTTDGHAAYLSAVDNTFGNDIDYAMLIKIYGAAREGEARYSPAECIGCERKEITGKPGFSKRIEHHVAAIALHFMYYNFVRIHQTLRVTPAMAAGVSDRVWEISDIIGLLDSGEK